MNWRFLFALSVILSIGLTIVNAQSATNSRVRVLNLIGTETVITSTAFDEPITFEGYSDWFTPADDADLQLIVDEVPLEPYVLETQESDSWTTLIVLSDDSGTPSIVDFVEYQQEIEPGNSHVTFVNLLGDVVNIYLDNALFAENLQSSFTDLLSVDIVANEYLINVSEERDSSQSVGFESGYSYLTVIHDIGGTISFVVVESNEKTLEDENINNAELVPEEFSVVRFGHLSSGTPPIDIYLDGEVTPITTLRFPQLSQWFQLPAGQHEIIISLSEENIDEPLLDPIEINLEPDNYGDFVLIGALANNSLETRYLQETFEPLGEATSRVGFFNAHPASGPVDVRLVSGASLIDRLAYPGYFGNNDGFTSIVLDSAQYDIEAYASDTEERLFQLLNRNFIGGRNYFIAIIAADPPFLLTFSDVEETRSLLENMSDDE